MNSLSQLSLFEQSPFDRIRHTDENGEYWLARELMPLLDYTKWQNFKRAIKDAQTSCKAYGQDPLQHFGLLTSVSQSGKGRKQDAEDFRLSRYACSLIFQNGDPSKAAIAQAQAYFAIQTRRMELVEEQKKLKRAQDVTAYQLRGFAADRAERRVDTKESHAMLTSTLKGTHEEHKPDYGDVFKAQNAAIFNLAKKQIVDYLGLLPKQADNLRDHLGKYALQAIDIANRRAAKQMALLRRELNSDEQIAIVRDSARQVAAPLRELALLDDVDFVSGAELDEQGRPLIVRNVKLLK